jgi:hypothetical protein
MPLSSEALVKPRTFGRTPRAERHGELGIWPNVVLGSGVTRPEETR